MNKDKIYQDQALRAMMQRKAKTNGKPVLSDDFTERLMQRIEAVEKSSGRESETWWLRVVRIASSVAAALVVVLLIKAELPLSAETTNANTYYNIGNLPKSCTLENVYTRRSRQAETGQLTHTHLKQLIYEHK